jgi:hypothetical protein
MAVRTTGTMITACAALIFAFGAFADDLVGQASVIDGDTLEIHGTRIRLSGIDAPESTQLCRGDDSLQYRCGAKGRQRSRCLHRATTGLVHSDLDRSIWADRRELFGGPHRPRGLARPKRPLVAAYRSRCAITGCDAVEALEAAHIAPYRGEHYDHVQNGLLLRADLHSLFDLGLVSIDPKTMTVVIAAELVGTSYGELARSALSLPSDPRQRPSAEALAKHFEWTGISTERSIGSLAATLAAD